MVLGFSGCRHPLPSRQDAKIAEKFFFPRAAGGCLRSPEKGFPSACSASPREPCLSIPRNARGGMPQEFGCPNCCGIPTRAVCPPMAEPRVRLRRTRAKRGFSPCAPCVSARDMPFLYYKDQRGAQSPFSDNGNIGTTSPFSFTRSCSRHESWEPPTRTV